jgi:hypothetical protein
MTRRFYRWRKHILVAVATLPLFQATGTCDPSALVTQQLASATLSTVISSFNTMLANNFPGADILIAFLGVNRTPFIH